MSSSLAEPYVAEYLRLKAQIAALEAQADEARKAVLVMLDDDGKSEVGTAWTYPGLAVVTKVRGRVSESLDRGRLAKAGVEAETLDAATIRKEGAPSYRITVDTGEGEA